MSKRKRRREGIYFRQWVQSWYRSVIGKQEPLRDEFGRKIKGREGELDAEKACARLPLQPNDVRRDGAPDVAEIALDYLRRIKHDRSETYVRRAKHYLELFVTYVGVKTPARQITPALCERIAPKHRLGPSSQPVRPTLFSAAYGRPWNPNALAITFRKLARKLEFPGELTPHSFRHTFVTSHRDIVKSCVRWFFQSVVLGN